MAALDCTLPLDRIGKIENIMKAIRDACQDSVLAEESRLGCVTTIPPSKLVLRGEGSCPQEEYHYACYEDTPRKPGTFPKAPGGWVRWFTENRFAFLEQLPAVATALQDLPVLVSYEGSWRWQRFAEDGTVLEYPEYCPTFGLFIAFCPLAKFAPDEFLRNVPPICMSKDARAHTNLFGQLSEGGDGSYHWTATGFEFVTHTLNSAREIQRLFADCGQTVSKLGKGFDTTWTITVTFPE